ncbi:MAG: hypothetical protein V4487_05795 [Chlamydiota bacterium]
MILSMGNGWYGMLEAGPIYIPDSKYETAKSSKNNRKFAVRNFTDLPIEIFIADDQAGQIFVKVMNQRRLFFYPPGLDNFHPIYSLNKPLAPRITIYRKNISDPNQIEILNEESFTLDPEVCSLVKIWRLPKETSENKKNEQTELIKYIEKFEPVHDSFYKTCPRTTTHLNQNSMNISEEKKVQKK